MGARAVVAVTSIDEILTRLTEVAERGSRDVLVRRWLLENVFTGVATLMDRPFTPSPIDPELVTHPGQTLHGKSNNDADDIATALAAALLAAGFDVRIVAHAFAGSEKFPNASPAFRHAVVEVNFLGQWLNADAWSAIPIGNVAKTPTARAYGPIIGRKEVP